MNALMWFLYPCYQVIIARELGGGLHLLNKFIVIISIVTYCVSRAEFWSCNCSLTGLPACRRQGRQNSNSVEMA